MHRSFRRTVRTAVVLFGVALLSAAAFAQEPAAAYTRVLLPVVLGGGFPPGPSPGAYGSLWTTEFSLTNTSGTPVLVFPYFSTSNVICMLCTTPFTPANSTLSPALHTDAPPLRGTFLFIPRDRVADVSLSLRVRDLSRALQTWGTSLPIVHEDEFVARTISLIDLPVTDEFRQTVRIYGLDSLDATPVQVRLYGRDANPNNRSEARQDVLLGTSTLILTTDPVQALYTYKTIPAFAEINGVQNIASTGGYTRVRIDVTPLREGKRIWAFASVTNNTTQHVTILEPIRGQ